MTVRDTLRNLQSGDRVKVRNVESRAYGINEFTARVISVVMDDRFRHAKGDAPGDESLVYVQHDGNTQVYTVTARAMKGRTQFIKKLEATA